MLSSKQRKILLVDGYIREHEKSLNLSNIIPKSICAVIFEFQVLFDKWNKELMTSNAIISDDGSCVDIKNDEFGVISCTHIVKYGVCFKWRLKIIKLNNIQHCIVILAPDTLDVDTMKGNLHGCVMKGAYAWAAGKENSTWFLYKDNDETFQSTKYDDSNSLRNEGDTSQIKFNWKESALNFIANDQDFGNCLVTNKGKEIKITHDKEAGFRLVLWVVKGNGAVFMIDGEEF